MIRESFKRLGLTFTVIKNSFFKLGPNPTAFFKHKTSKSLKIPYLLASLNKVSALNSVELSGPRVSANIIDFLLTFSFIQIIAIKRLKWCNKVDLNTYHKVHIIKRFAKGIHFRPFHIPYLANTQNFQRSIELNSTLPFLADTIALWANRGIIRIDCIVKFIIR
jgi:hypothetical protein